MSLLPAAMRLPNDITPLGKKVVPLDLRPITVDPVKAFENLSHPFPDGRQCPVEKPRSEHHKHLDALYFGCDFAGAGCLDKGAVTVYQKALDEMRGDVYQQAFSMIMSTLPTGKTASEVMLRQQAEFYAKQKRNAAGINKDYETPWPTPKSLVEIRRPARAAKQREIAAAIPDGLYDNLRTGWREEWIDGNARAIRPHADCGRFANFDWGYYPDLPYPF
jgi:hypothetical protein